MIDKVKRFIIRFIGLYTSMWRKRDPSLSVFGAWFGQKYSDNPRFLYEYCLEKGHNVVWITKNEEVYKKLKKEQKPVAMAYSKEGRYYCRKAKYVFTSTDMYFDVNENCIGNAVLVNLWHGIPIKKIMWDDTVNAKYYSLSFRIVNSLLKYPLRKQYMLSTSPTMTKIFQRAFRLPEGHVLELGQSRNDGFFNGRFEQKKFSEVDYKRMIVYLPTHRNEGKSEMDMSAILPLDELNDFCRRNGILFVIKKHFYHNNEKGNTPLYDFVIDITGSNVDTQELLFNADVLITDYSSCFIDYLLLDRPIVFYPYDYEEYRKIDREMYFNYEEVAPDEVAMNKRELMSSLERICSKSYSVGEKQEKIKEMFYSKENQGVVSPQIYAAVMKIS